MKYKRRIYSLPNISPEEKAVTFAKCSRSPLSFYEIAEKLSQEEAEKFNKKWVIDFGHASIAEHAVVSLAVENVSILATKIIEDNRFASFTEKSTRYQVFEKNKYYFPLKIKNSKFADLYQKTIESLMNFYLDSFNKIFEIVKKENPIKDGAVTGFYLSQIKAKTCDIVRSALPLATLTNLGMTINARSLGHLIVKMFSHSLDEAKEIAQELKDTTIGQLPSLISWTKENEYLKKNPGEILPIIQKYVLKIKKSNQEVRLIHHDKEAENKIIAALIYRFSSKPYWETYRFVQKMDCKEKEKIIEKVLFRRKPMEPVPREFENIFYTFDILIDYGAFRDLQRHRVCTQINQQLTNEYGYLVAEPIKKYNLEKEFKKTMKRAEGAYQKIYQKFPNEAQYILPLAFRKRVLMTLNLRELFYLIPLRTSIMAHASYRLIVQKMYDQVKKVHPCLAKYIKVFR
ncbi:MAG: FAD-dependent thymidylate synthase [Bacteroidetes bacterium]|nr:FAD-dependent thymidylate synthase [Bacteroidota bacterium]